MEPKNKLLATRMTELGLGKNIEKVFSFDILKKPVPPEEIMILEEFFTSNQHITKKTELLICNNQGQEVLNQQTTSGKILIQFLLESGFTEKDLKILGFKKKVKEEKLVITSETDKELLKKLPYTRVCGLRPTVLTTKYINRILELTVTMEHANVHTLGSLLQLSQASIMSTFFNSEFPVDIFPRIAVSLQRAQANLAKLGYSEHHGPFMLIQQKWFSKRATYCDSETILARVKDGQLDLGFTAGKLAHLPGVSESAMAG